MGSTLVMPREHDTRHPAADPRVVVIIPRSLIQLTKSETTKK